VTDPGKAVLHMTALSVRFRSEGRESQVVADVNLSVGPSECVGIIGESGSGKSVTGLAIAQLLPDNAIVTAGAMHLLGRTLGEWSSEGMDRLHGTGISMIFQDPAGAFNPAKMVGWHLVRCIRRRRQRSGRPDAAATLQEAIDYLRQVEIKSPDRVVSSYPHQLSGGMLQRALIAMTLALEPGLIIADEPTTNLDKPVEAQILRLLRGLQARLRAGMIFITHDLLVAATVCDRICVMYAGQIVERGSAEEVLARPAHPYTVALLEAATSLEQGAAILVEIRGEPRRDGVRLDACAFAPRCPRVQPRCTASAPPDLQLSGGRSARCWLAGEDHAVIPSTTRA
jgi:peptide/nickel transport system ATP-binding protein